MEKFISDLAGTISLKSLDDDSKLSENFVDDGESNHDSGGPKNVKRKLMVLSEDK